MVPVRRSITSEANFVSHFHLPFESMNPSRASKRIILMFITIAFILVIGSLSHATQVASVVRLRIGNLNLYRAAPWVRAGHKRTNPILDRKPMRHQLSDVAQHAGLHEPNRLWPRIGVPVLELEIHLPRRQAHKRKRYLALPNADDEHGPTKSHRLDRSPDRRLRTRALQRDIRLHAAHRLHNPRREVLWRLSGRYTQRAHAPRCKRLCERESPRI
jgi:hypothetical protein